MGMGLTLIADSTDNQELKNNTELIAEFLQHGWGKDERDAIAETVAEKLRSMLMTEVPEFSIKVRYGAWKQYTGKPLTGDFKVTSLPVFARNSDNAPLTFMLDAQRGWLFQTPAFDKASYELRSAFGRGGTVRVDYIEFRNEIIVCRSH